MHSLHQAAAHAHAVELRRSADRNHGHHHQVAPPIRAVHWPRSVRAAIAARAQRAPIGRSTITVEPGG